MGNKRTHNSENYRATEKMQVWVREKNSSGPFMSMGNIVSFSHDVQNTALEHFSNYLGQRAKDREIVTERKLTLDFVVDEMNMDILKLIHGFGFDAATSGTKDKSYDRTKTNRGGGVDLDLGVTGIKADSVLVRSTTLDPDVTYVEEALETDSTEVTAGGDFNNVTSPLTVVGAATTYNAITFAEGVLIKIQNEILKVTAVDGDDVTFARAQFGTVAATHADALEILISGGADYFVDLTNGIIYPMIGGDLEDEGTVAEIHIYFEKTINVKKFEMFPGDVIECEAKIQFDEDIEGPFESCFLKNNGPIDLGDGSDTRKVSLRLEIAVDADGSFGEYGKETT